MSLASSSLSSSSSAALTANLAYREDVIVATATFAGSGSIEAVSFRRELGRIARAHGITDWEAFDETWVGLGWGLRYAGLSDGEVHALLSRTFGEAQARRARVSVATP